ncbi:ImmA/IrrE family metallo-endopeptidase [Halobacillus seohaensis]|uniref:ImmA/IrrE family metallo-endopeptidase n=1 Tax=Halobacillus seohaensis TaxID=447421 RepID=A0ABW2EL12_9BACI
MYYYTTNVEDFVRDIYYGLEIDHPDQLIIEEIARKLDIYVVYWDKDSQVINWDNEANIFLNRDLSTRSTWQQFAHELCHPKRHAGNQSVMPLEFIHYQEWDAHSFSLHFCIPTFMLLKMELPFNRRHAVKQVADTFNVTIPFASQRLYKYENQWIGSLNHNMYHGL